MALARVACAIRDAAPPRLGRQGRHWSGSLWRSAVPEQAIQLFSDLHPSVVGLDAPVDVQVDGATLPGSPAFGVSNRGVEALRPVGRPAQL